MIVRGCRSPITPMERRVVRLISLGCTVKETAAILQRSVHTIDNHKSKSMRKLGAHNLAVLTRRAIEEQITSLDDALTAEELSVVNGLTA